MAVEELIIQSREPYLDGRQFGDTGDYDRIDGRLRFRVDPDDAANAGIVDLGLAARSADGTVAFESDFCALTPSDPTRGNRRAVLEVLNRGRKLLPRMLNHAPVEPVLSEHIHPGDGFLLQRGWTIAWCGWQWDVVRTPALMGLNTPMALENNAPVAGQVMCEFQPNEPSPDKLLANRVHHPYPAVDVDDPSATLTVRSWPGGERTAIPRERWRFAHDENGQPIPDDTHIWLDTGFEPGRVYGVVYRTRIAPIVGTGLLAVRDAASLIRSNRQDNPFSGAIDHMYGFGMSQSGRFLRHFLYLGLNVDEQKQQVFDGLLIHVAGARRGEFNQRYGQPSLQNTPGFGHLFPFADDKQVDPFTGQSDGILRRQRELGSVPRVLYTNTSAEYWRPDCSLGHISVDGHEDLSLPEEVRNYHFSSTQHGLGVVPLVDRDPNEGLRGAHPFNAHDYAPLLRAALINLDAWASEGRDPPPSRHPRLSDETAVTPDCAFAPFRSIPDVCIPTIETLPTIHRVDLGSEQKRGIGAYPARLGERYQTFVPAVDSDGNELGGVRSPDVTVPIASYTGWNPRHPDTGGPGQILSMQGSTFPFPATAEERERTGDPRLSIEGRYPSREEYLERVRAAAEELVAGGYMLSEDIELAISLAADRVDELGGEPWRDTPTV